MSIDPDAIEIANKIITEYKDIDINTIKKSDFLWTELEKYDDYDEKKMVTALRNFVIEIKRLPISADELIPYFNNLPNGGKRRRSRRGTKRKSKRLRKRRGTRKRK